MYLIAHDQIIIPENRQRRTFDDQKAQELLDSISEHGLLSPVVLRETPEGYALVCGERRLRAVADLWSLGRELRFAGGVVVEGQIPCVSLGDLSPLAAREAELEENIRREDLTWKERSAATAELSALRAEQALARGLPPPTVADLSEEIRGSRLGSSHDDTRKEIIVSQFLNNPDIAKAKTLNDAFKILRQQETTARNAELARTVGLRYSSASHTLTQGDCRELLRETREAYDVILADPPFGMDADKFGDAGGRLITQDHRYNDSFEHWRSLMMDFAPLSYAIAKPLAHAYVMCDIEGYLELRAMMAAAGWYTFRTPLINYKTDGNRAPLPQHGPQRKYDLILYCIKGWKPCTHLYPDVIHTTGDDNLGYGAQKPVGLYTNLLQRSACPGDRVVDPFCGTGTIFIAAHQLRLYAEGIELDEVAYGIALNRLRSLDLETANA